MNFTQVSREELRENLYDAGCDDKMIQESLDCFECQDTRKQMILLKKQRCNILEKIHIYQKRIDCLDYLILKIKKK